MPEKNFLFIHGTNGWPEENWFPWLKHELESRGFNVSIPDFPTGENQSLENWLKEFEKYEENVDENTVFIAHSLGPAFVMNLLEKKDFGVKHCFFVSAFSEQLGLEDFDPLNGTFVERAFDWRAIKENSAGFTLVHSDNDPYVPLEKAEFIAEKLDADLEIIEGGGHLNEDAGYEKFPHLLELIEEELKI